MRQCTKLKEMEKADSCSLKINSFVSLMKNWVTYVLQHNKNKLDLHFVNLYYIWENRKINYKF